MSTAADTASRYRAIDRSQNRHGLPQRWRHSAHAVVTADGNFDEINESDTALLRTIATFEELMESAGVIESGFAAIVARPRAPVHIA